MDRAAPLTCTECGHFFDPADKRALVFEERPDLTTCPACAIMGIKSVGAWAVYNGCQGIFTCGVGNSRKDAEARLNSGDYEGAGCTVVPVRVIVEPDDRRWIREWQERELRS